MINDLFYTASRSTADNSGGIYGMTVDNSSGRVKTEFFQELYGTSYLAYSGDRKTLYASCAEGKTGAVAALKIKPDGSLEFLNRLASKGVSTCYVIAAPGGKYLYTASYFTSNVSEFSLNSDGSLKALERVITFSGKSVDVRQECPHPHFVNFTPDQSKLLVVDLGVDEIKLFDFDPEKGLTDPENPYVFKVGPAGVGPRHLVFNSVGNTAYLINELGNTVCVLEYKQGEFRTLQQITTLPEDFHDFSQASAIRLSPDERFLFASNRGYDSVAVYRVLADGLLELQEIVSSGGVSPRDINFLPGGRHFAAANEFSDNTVFFNYDPASGKLSASGIELALPRPLASYW